jgi:hypothetical protein
MVMAVVVILITVMAVVAMMMVVVMVAMMGIGKVAAFLRVFKFPLPILIPPTAPRPLIILSSDAIYIYIYIVSILSASLNNQLNIMFVVMG